VGVGVDQGLQPGRGRIGRAPAGQGGAEGVAAEDGGAGRFGDEARGEGGGAAEREREQLLRRAVPRWPAGDSAEARPPSAVTAANT
jgi:hypothetical protein